jgi:phosphatidate cytidylyltransferase
VADSQPASGAEPSSKHGNLALRVVSSLVLAPVALAITYVGGTVFALFWTVVAAIVLWEWTRLAGAAHVRPAALAGWLAVGSVYAGVLLFAPLFLRRDPTLGLTAVLFLFAIVWATDIAAYFAGRAIGGPKLWPAVSPKKTWSGALAGALVGTAAGLLVAKLAGLVIAPMLVFVGLALSVAAQGGDLLESSVKRHFGAKDASQLIPGHGGLMDRLDGFLTAAAAAAMVGLLRGGFDGTARGLLVW